MDFSGFDIAIGALALLVLVLLIKGIRTIPQGYNYTVERFGRYTKTLSPGLNFIFPFVDRIGAKMNMGRYKEMAVTLDRVLAISPKDVPSRVRRALVDLEGHADPTAFHTVVGTILSENADASLCFVNPWLFVVLRAPDPTVTQRALFNMTECGCFDENIPFPSSWCEGQLAKFRGNDSAARAAFTSARNELGQMAHNQPNYAAALCALGVLDAVLGNKEDAIREGERAVELTPVSENAIEGATLVRYLAVIYAWVTTASNSGRKTINFTFLSIFPQQKSSIGRSLPDESATSSF